MHEETDKTITSDKHGLPKKKLKNCRKIKTIKISYRNPSNYNIYKLLNNFYCHFSNHCCLLQTDFHLPLEVATTNKLSQIRKCQKSWMDPSVTD